MPERGAPQDVTVGELAVQLTEQTSRLVHDEVELAKAEIRESVKHAGIGAGLFGATGLLAVLGLGTLVAAAVVVVVVVQVCTSEVETGEEDQSADSCAEQERRRAAPAGGSAACAVGSGCAAGVARTAAESARRAYDSGAACPGAGA